MRRWVLRAEGRTESLRALLDPHLLISVWAPMKNGDLVDREMANPLDLILKKHSLAERKHPHLGATLTGKSVREAQDCF